MAKFDRISELSHARSMDKEKIAVQEMKRMYEQDEEITIAELVRRTGLSRGFFYNNKKISEILRDYMKLQSGKTLKNPKHETIEKAQSLRIRELEKQIKNSVPKAQYQELQKKYRKLEQQVYASAFDKL